LTNKTVRGTPCLFIRPPGMGRDERTPLLAGGSAVLYADEPHPINRCQIHLPMPSPHTPPRPIAGCLSLDGAMLCEAHDANPDFRLRSLEGEKVEGFLNDADDMVPEPVVSPCSRHEAIPNRVTRAGGMDFPSSLLPPSTSLPHNHPTKPLFLLWPPPFACMIVRVCAS